MLYEAVYWRASPMKPTFDDALADPDFTRSLADWRTRQGDTAVIATIEAMPAGAAWYRFWTDDNHIRGYINATIPVLVIGVHGDYRHQGIGTAMLERLIDYASVQRIQHMSLAVSKDNHAINLYRQQDFTEYADRGDTLIMIRDI